MWWCRGEAAGRLGLRANARMDPKPKKGSDGDDSEGDSEEDGRPSEEEGEPLGCPVLLYVEGVHVVWARSMGDLGRGPKGHVATE